jgi:hypothetical protein
VKDELARSEVQRIGGLVEDGAELFEGQNSERVGRNGDDACRTKIFSFLIQGVKHGRVHDFLTIVIK